MEQAIYIQDEGYHKAKRLMKNLVKANLSDNWLKFDLLDCGKSLSRTRDEEMTLDMFLPRMDESSIIALSLGRMEIPPYELFQEMETISMMVRNVHLKGSVNIERFAWYFCKNSQSNQKEFKNIFKSIYKKGITNYFL